MIEAPKGSAIDFIAGGIMPLAMQLIPGVPRTIASDAVVLAIGFQESEFIARFQVMGPARSFFQFEQWGGVNGVFTHPATKSYLPVVCEMLAISCTVNEVYSAMADNDVLACVMARLLLYSLPNPLPTKRQSLNGWGQYRAAWNPGMPRKQDWSRSWAMGWAMAEKYFEAPK